MYLLMPLFLAGLFFTLTPRVLFTLPPKGKLYVIALVHALIFALIYFLFRNYVWDALTGKKEEGFFIDPSYGELGYDCEQPSDCVSNNCKNNVCAVIPGTAGSKCMGKCANGFSCYYGFCQARQGNGAACISDVLCQSGFCPIKEGTVSGKCRENPNVKAAAAAAAIAAAPPPSMPPPPPSMPPSMPPPYVGPIYTQSSQTYAPPPPVPAYAAPAQLEKFGSPCSSSNQCVTGYCDGGDGLQSLCLMVPESPPNGIEIQGACSTWNQCKSRYCRIMPGAATGICLPPGGVGSECLGRRRDCERGNYCDMNTTCQAMKEIGQPCIPPASMLDPQQCKSFVCIGGVCSNPPPRK